MGLFGSASSLSEIFSLRKSDLVSLKAAMFSLQKMRQKEFCHDLQVPRHVNALNMSLLAEPEALIGSAQLIPQRPGP